jgi:c-di-GMP-binding flagellar brake protein YcgR
LTRTNGSQKRNHYRTGVAYPIWYRDFRDMAETGDWVHSVSRDLSGGGASFEMPDFPPAARKPGDLLELQVVVPPTPVFAIAEVVRVFEEPEGSWCAGVKFASIDASDRDRIVRTVLSEGVKGR